MVFFVFSKTVLKNSFQKKQPNMPLVFLKLANVENMFAMIQDILYVRAMRGLAMVKKLLDFFYLLNGNTLHAFIKNTS